MTGRAATLRVQAMAAEYVERMGARIRERRDELHMSRSEVAREMGGLPNENAIYRWETGKHEPNAAAKEELARVLRVSTSYFYSDAPVSSAGDVSPHDASDVSQLDRMEAKLDRLLSLLESTDADDLEHLAAAEEFAAAGEQAADRQEAEVSGRVRSASARGRTAKKPTGRSAAS